MNMARVLALASRILRQVVRDKRTLALIFVVPIVVMTLLYLVLTSTSSVRTLAIVRPTGPGSESIDSLITKLLPGKDKLNVIYINADQVDSTLQNGNADAAIIFSPDFGQQMLNNQQPTVQIKLEGSDPGVASAMSDLTQSFTRQLGIAIAALRAQETSGQSGQGVSPVLGGQLPFTIGSPQYLHGGPQYTFNDSLAPVFIGIFSFFFVFILTSVAFLRERSQGTIERVLVSPLTRAELVLGYICGFTLFALVQSLMILLFVVFALRVHYSGNLALVFLVTALLTIGSVNLGIFLSTFAQNEFQIVQFIPLVFGVQVFLSGIFWPIAQLPAVLRPIAYILPLTYANDALRGVMLKGEDFVGIAGQLGALLLFALLMVLLSSFTTRRQIA
ncbi:MAG TPA: ABC transporter permease [Ktedonobacteraceae bacterium]|jgi:ABC-2 type transport system permease protein|nr:ABC transporter permease [Ktedonobacteraceae bacterium]